MTFKQAALLSLCGLAAIVSVPVVIISLVTWGENAPHPSDERLLKDFTSKEANLNRLLDMSNEDAKVIRIAHNFTRLDDDWGWPRPESKLGFSTERWNEYRDLFSKLGLPVGLERAEPKDGIYVYFPISTRGLGNGHGTSKGYAYLEKEVQPLLDSLNDESVRDFYSREKPEHQLILYRRIKGNWYLFRG